MQDEGIGESKHYEVGLDVLASSGPQALNTLAERENTVYVNFEELEARASDHREPHRQEYKNVLRWTNKQERRSNGIKGPSGGMITWKEVPDNNGQVTYITRCPIMKSKMLREGRPVSFPDFLKYSGQALKSGLIKVPEFANNPTSFTIDDLLEHQEGKDIHPHQYVLVNNTTLYQITQNMKKRGDHRWILTGSPHLEKTHRENTIRSRLPSLEARNLEQRIAFEQLTNPDVEISFLTGGSGSGKTVIAYGAALHLLLGTKDTSAPTFDGIVLFKSNDIIGGKHREMGFLPGTADEKMVHHLKSYKDAHILSGAQADGGAPFERMLIPPREYLSSQGEQPKRGAVPNIKIGKYYLSPKHAALEIEHLQYARGRTFEKKIVFVDEAQNYSPFEMKQLLERVGVGSKIFLVGDPEQVDNPTLAPDFNGLVFAADTLDEAKKTSHPRVSFMALNQNYRSQTAEIMRNRRAPGTL